MELINKYPFEMLYKNRRNEILSDMLKTDNTYKQLCDKRKNASMALKKILIDIDGDILFENYSNSIFEQEI